MGRSVLRPYNGKAELKSTVRSDCGRGGAIGFVGWPRNAWRTNGRPGTWGA